MKTTEQELQASNATIKAIRDGLAGVLPKDVVIPEGNDALAGFIGAQFTTANTRATNAETDLGKATKANETLTSQNQTLTQEKANLTEANEKLKKENTDLAAKEQDLVKRTNAAVTEHLASMSLSAKDAPTATKAGKESPGATGSITEQVEAIKDPRERARARAKNSDKIWKESFRQE